MKLTHTRIRHYKSLSEVDFELHPNVTVLVGPNAAGKSNYVDALRFLRDAATDGLDHAMLSRGGLVRMRQNADGEPFNIGLAIKGVESLGGLSEPAGYALEIGSASDGNFRVEREEALSFHEEHLHRPGVQEIEQILFPDSFIRDSSGNVIEQIDGQLETSGKADADRLALGVYIGRKSMRALGSGVQDALRRWKFSALYPNTLRQLATADTDASLRDDGSNWASVIRAAERSAHGKRMLERINEMMRVVLPDFLDVTITTAGSYLVPTFRFQAQGQTRREFDPVQLSDGTLRIFGILLSLYQSPTPSLMVIEEPEQTVHPGVLSMLAEAFKEVSEVTQIIVTTHSPQLVEHFDPEHIRVVTMTDGVTRISPIKASQREAVQRGLMTLGEFMAAEGLQPETP
jgi:predicted ATPase